jgi:hypothetical protein
MKHPGIRLAVAVVALLLVSCAGGPNPLVGAADPDGVVAGFWRGLWHGVISPVTFVVSLFTSQVHLYEVHNNGGWYDLGFLMGITSVHGGGQAARSRPWRRGAAASTPRT